MKYILSILFFSSLVSLSFVSYKQIGHRGNPANMVLITGGIYMRGLDSARLKNDMARFDEPASFFSQEYPAIRYSVSTFYLDKYEVTNADFKKFIDANPKYSKSMYPDNLNDGNYLKDWDGNNYPEGKGNYPVVYVCYQAANAYAAWVGKRLPVESEWEYAARGGEDKASWEFSWGNEDASPKKANYLQVGLAGNQHVGKYKANKLGICDMAGNVAEICADRWRQDSYALTQKLIVTSSDPNAIVIRGGSWADPAVKLRSSYREKFGITSCSATVGFRCAMNAK